MLLHMHEMPSIRRQSSFPHRRQSSSPHCRQSSSPHRHKSLSPHRHHPHRLPINLTTSVTSLLQYRRLQIRQTAIAVIDTGSNYYEIGVLTDPCTPVSSDSSLTNAFRLPTISVGENSDCSTKIRSRSGNFKMEIVLKTIPNLRVRTPIQALNDEVRAKFNDIRLADE